MLNTRAIVIKTYHYKLILYAKKSNECKIQWKISIKFVPSEYTNDNRVMLSKSNNI